MLKVRRALSRDKNQILKIQKKMDLYYPSQSLEYFWVAEKEDEIIGVARLEEYKNCYFLSSLGVLEAHRKKRIASSLLSEITKGLKKNVYLYTIIPEFFEKFGFEAATPLPGLPSKEILECENCFPDRCTCMVKFPDVA